MNLTSYFRKPLRVVSSILIGIVGLSQIQLIEASATSLTPNGVVTFFENASAGDSVSSYEVYNQASTLTSFANMSPQFSNPGNSFLSWNTQPSGTGTAYPDGGFFNFATNLTLYVQWRQNVSYTLSFSTNGGSGQVSSISAAQGSSVSAPVATSLSRAGYTFSNWNTSADGSGSSFQQGASVPVTGNLTLYAQWTPQIFTVTFNSEGGQATSSLINYTYGGPSISLPAVTRAGQVSTGWWTSPTGGSLVGPAGSSYNPVGSSQLFAQWTPAMYLVTFNPGSGTSSVPNLSFQAGTSGVALPAATLVGSSFNGWYSQAVGGQLVGVTGAIYAPSGDATVYAQFTVLPTATVTFDSNGGRGTVSPITQVVGTLVVLSSVSGVDFPGYQLSSWNTSANGSGTTYSLTQSFAVNSSIELFAQWVNTNHKVLLGSVGSFSKNTVQLTAALKSEINKLAIAIKSKKYKKISIYGYTVPTGLVSLNLSISAQRAVAVATYLKAELAMLKVTGVHITSAGEGALPDGTTANFSRVEIFAQ